ncbi:MAG: glycosyltransferase, partial [bacterium]|nr:glycosyltransferase [bacterium]
MNNNENTEKTSSGTLIIIPTYNERENILVLLEEILKTVTDSDILVVDDDSPDGTAAEVEDFSKRSGVDIKLIVRKGIWGLGTAYSAGLKYGLDNGYNVMITMDADHSHNPVHLPSFYQGIRDHD